MLDLSITPFIKRVRKYYTAARLRNPDFASGWVYHEVGTSSRPVRASRAPSKFVKFFTKRRNYNKLYVSAGRSLFLSPGMVLRHFSDPEMRHLKKRTKTWLYALIALKRVTTNPWIVEFGDLFGKKEFLLKKMFKQKIPVSWIFFKGMFSVFRRTDKPKKRIKRWTKKKYFKLTSQAL